MSRPTLSRVRTLLLSTCAAAALSPAIAVAQAQEPAKFSIPAQDLSVSLNQFARQSDHLIVFSTDAAAGRLAPAVEGDLPPERALSILLAGTGLSYRREGDAFLIVQAGEGGSVPQDPGAAGGNDVEALIVTAQKKEEQIQDVPIAISAFTQKSLDAQKIEGGFDLLKAIPNVSFSKSNFSGYNFSIRGIGTKAVSATTDPGVAVSFNNTTLIVNRLFEQEYFDVERVEVLRGPQGTLYGRNATGGVINVISSRPRIGEFEGDLKLEGGNYNAQRVRGMVNIPIGDTLAVRAAGALTKRDGYGYNEFDGSDVDNRDLWSARVTVGWEPIEQIRVNALWERFEEDDERVRTSKQLCHHDAGPDVIGNFAWADNDPESRSAITDRARTSQGCLPGSLYADEAFGTVNGASLPYIAAVFAAIDFGSGGNLISGNNFLFGMGGNPYFDHDLVADPPLPAPCAAAAELANYYPIDICRADPYGGKMQSLDLRSINSQIKPTYRAKADIFELSFDVALTDSLSFTSQTVYATDKYYASQDYNRFATEDIFNDSDLACGIENFFGFGIPRVTSCPGPYLDLGDFYHVTPGGVFTDPQLGPSRSLVAQDLSQVESNQFNQEFRLASNFDAPFNFSLGANFTHFETYNDYYVFLNAATLLTHFFPFNTHNVPDFSNAGSGVNGGGGFCNAPDGAEYCVYVDPNPLASINGEGHNYFRSANPYELTSSAIFGELYWQAADTLKVTLGARMSWDEKVFTPIPSQLLLGDYRNFVPEGGGPEECTNPENCPLMGTGIGGRGSPANPDIIQEWREPTGRIIVDWKPDLGFTDETMVYASIAHGYKGGGANPPNIAPPAGIFNARNSGGTNPVTFEPEFIDALEIGTKNTLMGGALVLNGSAFYYDYEGYQVSKIVDRSAYNENFDATVWGLELEWIFSPARNLRFNGAVGHLRTEIAEGERSIDLMDRALGGSQSSWIDADGVEHALAYSEWMVLKPWLSSSSNCVAPVELVERILSSSAATLGIISLCPGGNVLGNIYNGTTYQIPGAGPTSYFPATEAPNGGAGFFTELAGHELPNAPHWTASLGAQYRFALPGGWDGTLRGDFYWQSQSFARVYNTQYDKLRAWTNTNISLWFEQPDWGVTAEVYVKNAFDEEPITDAFLNSDDSGLTTNVFTLDPRLIGVSVRKSF